MKGYIISAVIVIFWLAMMFSLVRDQILPTSSEKNLLEVDTYELATNAIADGGFEELDDWFVLLNEGNRIGGLRATVVETQRPVGFRADFQLKITLQVLKRDLNVYARIASQLDSSFNLMEFDADMSLWNFKMDLKGQLDNDHKLYLAVKQVDTDTSRYVVQLPGDVSLRQAIDPVAMRELDLRIGSAYGIQVLDPIFQIDRGKLVMVVDGYDMIDLAEDGLAENITAKRVVTKFGGMETLSWVDDEGRILRRQLLPKRPLYMESVKPERFAEIQPNLVKRFEHEFKIVQLDLADFEGLEPQPLEDFLSRESLSGIVPSMASIVPETAR